MAELPTPGGDVGTWGAALNAWLLVEHNADGTHTAPVDPGGGTQTVVASGSVDFGYGFAQADEQMGAPVSLTGVIGIVCQVSDVTSATVTPWPASGVRVQLLSTDAQVSNVAVLTEAYPAMVVAVPHGSDELASVLVGQADDGSGAVHDRTAELTVTLLSYG